MIQQDVPAAWVQQAAQATGAVLVTLRQLDHLPCSLTRGPRGLNHARHVFARVKAAHGSMGSEQHRALFDLPARPHYEVFNDNRYNQHWWSWSGHEGGATAYGWGGRASPGPGPDRKATDMLVQSEPLVCPGGL